MNTTLKQLFYQSSVFILTTTLLLNYHSCTSFSKFTSQDYTIPIYEGNYSTFYDNGKIKQTFIMKQGKRHGYYNKYFPNGKLSEKGSYFHDKKHGLWLIFYDNNRLAAQSRYKQGIKVGEWITKFKNGKIKYRRCYNSEGLKHGWWFDYVKKIKTKYYKNKLIITQKF